jgi:hypothetical protein
VRRPFPLYRATYTVTPRKLKINQLHRKGYEIYPWTMNVHRFLTLCDSFLIYCRSTDYRPTVPPWQFTLNLAVYLISAFRGPSRTKSYNTRDEQSSNDVASSKKGNCFFKRVASLYCRNPFYSTNGQSTSTIKRLDPKAKIPMYV